MKRPDSPQNVAMGHEQQLKAIVRGAPTLMQVLTTVRDLDLPDWLLFSGAIYQRVINHMTGRDPDYGVKDYDVGYFDPDTSYEAEDRVIKRVAAAFEPPLTDLVEVRNQARVHIWFPGKFGEPYPPLQNTAEAISRFTTVAFAVGVRLMPDDDLRIVAPFGLDDLFALTLRPNPTRKTSGFARTAENVMRRWPELTVVDG